MKTTMCILVALATNQILLCSNITQFNLSIRQPSLKQKAYRINKIDSISTTYLVYATRNDSLFKIASNKIKSRSCKSIRVGSYYPLQLNKGLGFLDCTIGYWNDIPLDWESRRDLYEAYNLKGLCLQD